MSLVVSFGCFKVVLRNPFDLLFDIVFPASSMYSIGKALGLRDKYTKDEKADELMSKMGSFPEETHDGDERHSLHFKTLEFLQ